MKKLILVLLIVSIWGTPIIAGAMPEMAPPDPLDNGPGEIDVSSYPKEMQDIYNNIFKDKCSNCHVLARPIGASYTTADEWKKVIKKMMGKPGSGIDPMSAKKISEFLIYDSSVRKGGGK
ncbi:MAG: hypothetical protein KKC21_05070 [Nitrospinae bacterium]|nr:hypothetical protein [Nitrospinota bacterium]